MQIMYVVVQVVVYLVHLWYHVVLSHLMSTKVYGQRADHHSKLSQHNKQPLIAKVIAALMYS
jgi:hypothetical protein